MKNLTTDAIEAHVDEYIAETLHQGVEVPGQELTLVFRESLSRELMKHFYMYVSANESLQDPETFVSEGFIAKGPAALKAYADEYISSAPRNVIMSIGDAKFIETHQEAFEALVSDFWLYVHLCMAMSEAK